MLTKQNDKIITTIINLKDKSDHFQLIFNCYYNLELSPTKYIDQSQPQNSIKMPNYTYDNTDGSSAINDDCFICDGKKNYSFYFICNGCDKWVHTRCLGYSKTAVAKSEKAYCPDCNVHKINFEEEPTTSFNQHESTEEPTIFDLDFDDYALPLASSSTETDDMQVTQVIESESTTDTDDEDMTHIKEIVDWCIRRNKRQFCVAFKKRPDERKWYNEEDLENCPLLMENFCLKKGIAEPSWLRAMTPAQREVGQFTSSKANDRSNWATVQEIIDKVKIYSDNYSHEIKKLEDFDSNLDGIYLIPIGHHCFVGLYFAQLKMVIISDGGGAYYYDKLIRQTLILKLRSIKKICYVPFLNQSGLDHCASSAAVICIEFQRILRNRKIPRLLRVPKTILDRIKKVLHKTSSPSILGRVMINSRMQLKQVNCPKCSKKVKDRRALNFHKC